MKPTTQQIQDACAKYNNATTHLQETLRALPNGEGFCDKRSHDDPITFHDGDDTVTVCTECGGIIDGLE